MSVKVGRAGKRDPVGAVVQLRAEQVAGMERAQLLAFNLSPSEELFAQGVAKGLNQTNAAVEAGYAATSAHVMGSKLIRRPKIAARIKQLQQSGLANIETARAAHLTELLVLRDAAKEKGQLAAAIKAEELRGKVLGLYVEHVVTAGLGLDGVNGKGASLKGLDAANIAELRKAIADGLSRLGMMNTEDAIVIDVTATGSRST